RIAERRHDGRLEFSQCRHVHVVVMIVADQDEIDRRQILEANPRRTMPPRTNERNRRNALRPNRISEDVDAVHLNERGRVIDEGDPQPPVIDPLRRRRTVLRLGMVRPRARLPRGLPFQKGPLGLPSPLTIVKPLAIKVIGDAPAPPRRAKEDALNCRGGERRADGDRSSSYSSSQAVYCSTKLDCFHAETRRDLPVFSAPPRLRVNIIVTAAMAARAPASTARCRRPRRTASGRVG